MSKIYLLTDGDYEDYHVVGVYSTKELAEKAEARYRLCGEFTRWGCSAIEEYELDKEVTDPPIKRFLVTADFDSNLCLEKDCIYFRKAHDDDVEKFNYGGIIGSSLEMVIDRKDGESLEEFMERCCDILQKTFTEKLIEKGILKDGKIRCN